MSRHHSGIYKNILRLAVLTPFAVALFSQCARPMAPQGGPIDSLPPVAVSFTPADRSTDFKGKRVNITFDEYVQLKDQQKEFFVSPFMEKKPTLTIKQKGVQIDFEEEFKPDQTYSLNFGGSIVDNNEGNPLTGFRYVFSTGKSVDSLYMSAYTTDAYTKDSVGSAYVMFFSDTLPYDPQNDSTVFLYKPAAVIKSLPNGIAYAENLKPQAYRIYAMEDNNSNQAYDPGTDRIAFMDSTYNPENMPAFDLRYDTLRRYWQADPQLYMRMFKETPKKQQRYINATRTEQGKVTLEFNAPEPVITELEFNGIDPERIITEYNTVKRDTMTLWITSPDNLPDTLRGKMIYMRHDSLSVLRPDTVKLNLAWKAPQTLRQNRRERDTEQDSVVAKPLQYTSDLGSDLDPLKDIVFSFGHPLVKADTTKFELTNINVSGKAPVPVGFTFRRDTLHIRRWSLSAQWKPSSEYQLFIPPGALVNTKGESNDSITLKFKTFNEGDYSKLQITTKGRTPDSKYVIQILGKGREIIREQEAGTGTYTFLYIPPGEIRIRIIDDINGNGQWDAGSVTERRQPEGVEIFVTESGKEEITAKPGWNLTYNIDMKELFSPVTMEDMKRSLARREEAYRQYLIKKREEDMAAEKKKSSNNNSNNMGFSSGMNSMGSGNMNNFGR